MKHILFKLEGCPFSTLNDEEHIKFCLFHASEASHSKVIKVETQKFVPQGVTGFALLADSHISIHTWPENNVAKCDIFTCNEKCTPYKAVEYMKEAFKATELISQEHERI